MVVQVMMAVLSSTEESKGEEFKSFVPGLPESGYVVVECM